MGGEGPRICEDGGKGLFLPLLREHGEQEWPKPLRAVLYMCGLLWTFVGIAVVSDVFMSAIERITSQRYRRLSKATGRNETVLVWNATVSNLTLMALGSSAPEILLSVIEILGTGFFSGDLGPSTIVGSAAFNHLVISAVCVSAIPDGDLRAVRETNVYAFTVTFSIFAYVWLLIILLFSSPNVVESWEGIVTFLLFPLLVGLAYLVDKGHVSLGVANLGTSRLQRNGQHSKAVGAEDMGALVSEVRKLHGAWLSDEQVAAIVDHKHSLRENPKEPRRGPLGIMLGSGAVEATKDRGALTNVVVPFNGPAPEESSRGTLPHIPLLQFTTDRFCVLENAGTVTLPVCRKSYFDDSDSGLPSVVAVESKTVYVTYRTIDGSAKGGIDFKPVEETLEFLPGVDQMNISIGIVDNDIYEKNKEFYVELSEDDEVTAIVGQPRRATVLIVDDDLPGTIGFEKDELRVVEGIADSILDVNVRRSGGSCGRIGCKFQTENGTAVSGTDYEQSSGILAMEPGQLSTSIQLTIKATGIAGRSDMLRLVLSEPFGGSKFDTCSDGYPEFAILSVWIASEFQAKDSMERITSSLSRTWAKQRTGRQIWKEQFVEAIFGSGEEDEAEAENSPRPSQIIVWWSSQIISCPWKVFAAFVPPVDYCGGWACFVMSLIMIGAITAFVGDLAGMLGCVIGVPDEITAITFVALGTSMPDTFASMNAAVQDPIADASIGNVTGSNSVNVFLGLGLPWLMASLYWENRSPTQEWTDRYGSKSWTEMRKPGAALFVVEAGSLAFSVAVFSVCACTCVTILFIRRRLYGGELGGPTVPKRITSAALLSLWVIYIAMSSWYTLREKAG
eukprot:TRINITY_DN39647_c0_g1_i1.p1 TRINITY_DN39647_c0_g1~~TRINITY_DN39647_c0_g1_i1.p1  ORF type:complete len:846 (-),score=129.44 TRINITY_DN39647_c0_g1_i1:58-2595(-)